jgi:hypothetical protein
MDECTIKKTLLGLDMDECTITKKLLGWDIEYNVGSMMFYCWLNKNTNTSSSYRYTHHFKFQ